MSTKKLLYKVYYAILVWYLLFAGVVVTRILFSYWLYNIRSIDITLKSLYSPAIVAFLFSVYINVSNYLRAKKESKMEVQLQEIKDIGNNNS